MREIVHIQAGQCGNQIGAKVQKVRLLFEFSMFFLPASQDAGNRIGHEPIHIVLAFVKSNEI
jgi:hypothetical protein